MLEIMIHSNLYNLIFIWSNSLYIQEFYNGDLINCEHSYDKRGRTAKVSSMMFPFSSQSINLVSLEKIQVWIRTLPKVMFPPFSGVWLKMRVYQPTTVTRILNFCSSYS